ncbi:MAG: hypothetical protein HY858_00695 [Candidatus Solibacter usitatus]|nr:hypothetical protein [Candidatus Solibacter usitatus]
MIATQRRKPGLSRPFTPTAQTPSAPVPGGDPVLWATEKLHFTPDPLQAEILSAPEPNLILCCTRQFGKSTITAIKALHHALSRPNACVLVAAPTERQSAEWILKTRAFLRTLGIRPRTDSVSRFSLLLPNASRIIGLPGVAPTTRGFSSASLIIFEEAAFIRDDLFQSLSPSGARSNAAIWLISTPQSQTGFFYEAWHRSDAPNPESPGHRAASDSERVPNAPLLRRFQVTAADCPSISKDFLDRFRLNHGDAATRREFFCEFAASNEQVFDRDLLDAALNPDFAPFNGGRPLWRD